MEPPGQIGLNRPGQRIADLEEILAVPSSVPTLGTRKPRAVIGPASA
jgi:hypothetical protein